MLLAPESWGQWNPAPSLLSPGQCPARSLQCGSDEEVTLLHGAERSLEGREAATALLQEI